MVKVRKKLGEIISDETKKKAQNLCLDYENLEVSGICDDSRKASEGSVFVAINGNAIDGTKYIDDAILRGAKYVVLEGEKSANKKAEKSEAERSEKSEKVGEIAKNNHQDVVFIYTKNSRKELAYIASHFFEKNLEDIIAVTGTNGKSSTVDIVRQIWTFAGRNAVSIGTLGLVYGDGGQQKLSGTLTCPPAIVLHRIFYDLSQRSENFSVALEASSHGIDQHRLDFIPFSVCAFTNFSQDHLDYHKTMDRYWEAKERFFSEFAEGSAKFVVNADDPKSERIKEIAKCRKIRCIDYGYNAEDIRIIATCAEKDHQKIEVLFFGKHFSFSLPIIGKFQVYNALCAAGICYLTGVCIEDIVRALENLHPINGRLELVAQKYFEASKADSAEHFRICEAKICGARVYVDYAHTPDALKNAILSLREHRPKRVITLFGCGGNRDHDKRKIMGEIAAEFSDLVVVTDDNPREESPAEIRKMILDGCQRESSKKGSEKHAEIIEIGDREKAIECAIDMLREGDALLIAGKGHENYQQIGTEFIHFDDKEVVLRKLKMLKVLNKRSRSEGTKCE